MIPGPVSIDDRKPGFQSGGTLRSGSIYVERPADVELVEALEAGEFCYVLAPRQIGKSSLRARAAERLEARGVRCAAIDLNRIGSSDLTPDQWYASLGHTLARQLHLSKDPSAPASSILDRSPVERWFAFLRDPLLSEIKGRVVLFIDEIDSVRSLPFETDDFFAFIRAIHNARPDDPAFERLTVCLIGVATPGDLIRDPDKTPFNIGRGIRLEDFTPDEAEALLPGLEDLGDSPRALLRAVLDWTDGHPYMTQRVCDELARAGPSDRGAVERVAEVIERVFLTGGRTEDASLADADRRFSARGGRAVDPLIHRMLQLYRRLLGPDPVVSKRSDPAQIALCLTGLAAERRENGRDLLRVRNRIFATVFDNAWVAENDSDTRLARYAADWIAAGRGAHYLIRGQALAEMLEWARQHEDITLEERQFLGASQDAERRGRGRLITALAAALALLAGLTASLAYSGQLSLKAAAAGRQLHSAAVKLTQLTHEQQRAGLRLASASRAEQAARRQAVEAIRRRRLADRSAADAVLRTSAAKHAAASALNAAELAQARALRAGEQEQLAQTRAAIATEEARARVANAIQIEDGARASALAQQTGREFDALAAGIQAVESSVNAGVAPPPEATKGLMDAVTAGHFRLLKIRYASRLTSAVFSPDERRILTSSADHTAQIWDARSGRLLKRLIGHTGIVNFAIFSPDGRYILTGSSDGSVRLWNGEAGPAIYTSRNSRGQPVGPGRIWNGETGAALYTLTGIRGGAITTGAFSPDSQQFVTAGHDGIVRFWITRTGKSANKPLQAHSGAIRSVAFSPDGARVVAAGDDGITRQWNAVTEEPIHLAFSWQRGAVLGIAMSPDQKRIATAGQDGTVVQWNYKTGGHIDTVNAHSQAVDSVCYGRGHALLVTASKDQTVSVFDAFSGSRLQTIPCDPETMTSAVFNHDATRVLTASGDGSAQIWLIDPDPSLQTLLGHTYDVVYAAFYSPDGRQILSAGADGVARLWDAKSGVALGEMDSNPPDTVTWASFSPHGRRVVIARRSGSLSIWDTSTFKLIRTLPSLGEEILSAFFSPNGRFVLTASVDGTARVWDLNGSSNLIILNGRRGPLMSAAFSPDNRRIVTSGEDGRVILWNAKTGAQQRIIQASKTWVYSAVFSADGRRILTASKDGTARLWGADTGQPLPLILRGHEDDVVSAYFSPHERRIVTAGADGTVRIWNAATGAAILTIPTHQGWVYTAAFSPDGTRVVAACADGVVRTYPTTVKAFYQIARRILSKRPKVAPAP